MRQRVRSHAALAAVLCAALVAAESSEPEWSRLNSVAGAAAEKKDYAKLRETLLQLRPLLPGNPRVIYNLACADAKLGNSAEAFAQLRNLTGMGLFYDFRADDDFSSLFNTAEFAAIEKRAAENKQPVTHAQLVQSLPEADLLPEDIAYDPATRRFFVSSVRKAKIVTTGGKEFAKTDWPVLALRVDANRRTLWAATGWVPHCERCDKRDKDKTALLAFDLDSGALKQRIDSPVKGLFGDMTIGDGGLYVSEGIHGAVFHLPPGGKTLERLDTPGEFPSPQTPALSMDGRILYVPDYLRGIGAMDLATRHVTWQEPAGDVALNGIDGLYLFGKSFVAVQNGTHPPRIVRLNGGLQKTEVLEANTPWLGEPTHGTFVGNTFYFLANTGWDAYDDDGKRKPGVAPVISTIRKIEMR